MCDIKPVFPGDGRRKSDRTLQRQYIERLQREVAEERLRQEAPKLYTALFEYRSLVREFVATGKLTFPDVDVVKIKELDEKATAAIDGCAERRKSRREPS